MNFLKRIKTKLLFITLILIECLILWGQYNYVTDHCGCGPPHGIGMAITDIFFPVVWIITALVIIVAIFEEKWNKIIYVLIILLSTHLGHIVVDGFYNFDKESLKYNKTVIYEFYTETSIGGYIDFDLSLYKDHYKIVKHLGDECGCLFIGKYIRRNDTIFFDEVIKNKELNMTSNNYFIEKGDTLFIPDHQSIVLIKYIKR